MNDIPKNINPERIRGNIYKYFRLSKKMIFIYLCMGIDLIFDITLEWLTLWIVSELKSNSKKTKQFYDFFIAYLPDNSTFNWGSNLSAT